MNSVTDVGQYATFMNTDPMLLHLLVYIAVVSTLSLCVAMVDLWVDLGSIRPRRQWAIKEAAADFGIALAERSTKGPSDLKLRNAVDFAETYCAGHKVKTTRNELAKIVEIRLPRKVKPPTA